MNCYYCSNSVLSALGREVRGLWVARVLEEWGLELQQDMVEGEKSMKAQTKNPDFRCAIRLSFQFVFVFCLDTTFKFLHFSKKAIFLWMLAVYWPNYL